MKRILYTLSFLVISASTWGQIDRSVMPEPGPSPEINLTEPQEFELLNGLKVMVVENSKLPRVSIQLTIDNPPILEGEKAGVSALTASLLGNGSKNISKDDFNEEVDFLGANISFGSQSAFARGLSKYFPRLIELMADAAINPNFTQEEFDKEKDKLLTGLKAQEKDVSSMANRVKTALAYGTDHPFGEFVTEESVNKVTLQDVMAFYREYFVPANAYLVVIGDVEYDEVKKLVETHFTPWTKASPPSFVFSEPSNVQYTQINFVDMPNAVQSEISVQNLVDLKMKDPDYLHALMANRILGGGAQARLFLNLREDKAYTYGAYSGIGDNKYVPSLFDAGASVRNMVTDSAVVEILKEIDRIILEPVTEEELDNAKAKYVGNFVMALEQPQTIARYALNIETEELPDDFYKTYLERINAITADDVQKAAEKYFTSSNSRVVVVGKGSEVIENLEKVTFNGKAVPVKYFDTKAIATEKPDYKADLPEGITVQSIIDAYFNAIGGKDEIENISSLKLVYEGEMGGAKVKTEEKRLADKYAQTTYMNDAPMAGVVAKGDEMYMKQGGNKMPLPEEMKTDMQQVMGIFPEQRFGVTDKAKLVGIEDVDGTKAFKIEVSGETIQASFFYDVESGLKIKETSVINMGGQSQNQETLFSDYEEVDGILFPGKRVSTFGPQQLESSLLEAVINKEFTEADFE